MLDFTGSELWTPLTFFRAQPWSLLSIVQGTRTLRACLYMCKISQLITGLLIFRAVAELRNSGKSAKSCEIHKNTQNTAKFGRNLSNTCLYSNFETCLSYWGYLLAVNSQIYVKTLSLKCANNILKLPGVDYVAKNWALAMMLKALPLFHFWSVLGNSTWDNEILNLLK